MADANPNTLASGSYTGIAHEIYCECGFIPSRIEIFANQTADSSSVWFTSMGTSCFETVVDVQVDATSNLAVSEGEAGYKDLLGTVAVAAGGRTLTGTNTHFLTQLKVGDEVLLGGYVYSVNAIASDTSATIDTNYGGTAITADTLVRVTGRGPGFTVANDAIRNNAGDVTYWCASR